MWIGLHLVRSGCITADQLIEAIEYREKHKPPIGQIAIQKRRLSVSDCFQVLSRQAIQAASFGRIARDLKLLTKRQVADLLLMQDEQTPSIGEALIAIGAIDEEELARETAQARFDRRLQDDLEQKAAPSPSQKIRAKAGQREPSPATEEA